jgi:hypothetical protein
MGMNIAGLGACITCGYCGRRIALLKVEKEGRERHGGEPQAW